MQCKFLTLNIWHGGLLMDHLLPFLQNEQADIMCLQEVNDAGAKGSPAHFRSVETLKRYFPGYYFAFDSGMKVIYKEGAAEHGLLTISRFPIKSHQLIYFTGSYTEIPNPLPGPAPDYRTYPAHMQKVEIELNEKKLISMNIHGVWDFHGNDTPERLLMSQRMLKEGEGEEYVIIAGDSNVRWQTKTIDMIAQKYPSVFTTPLPSTFNMKHKQGGGYATAAVDILHASPNIKVLESACPQVDVSDHLPLTATLEF